MQVLVSDANIFIDLEEGEILSLLFDLPYEFVTPDILFDQELEEDHGYLCDLGLKLAMLSGEEIEIAANKSAQYRGPGRNDCTAIVVALREACPLLTGYRLLREAAEEEGLIVMGTIWVLEQLIVHRLLTGEDAFSAVARMKAGARRLPWDLADTVIVAAVKSLEK